MAATATATKGMKKKWTAEYSQKLANKGLFYSPVTGSTRTLRGAVQVYKDGNNQDFYYLLDANYRLAGPVDTLRSYLVGQGVVNVDTIINNAIAASNWKEEGAQAVFADEAAKVKAFASKKPVKAKFPIRVEDFAAVAKAVTESVKANPGGVIPPKAPSAATGGRRGPRGADVLAQHAKMLDLSDKAVGKNEKPRILDVTFMNASGSGSRSTKAPDADYTGSKIQIITNLPGVGRVRLMGGPPNKIPNKQGIPARTGEDALRLFGQVAAAQNPQVGPAIQAAIDQALSNRAVAMANAATAAATAANVPVNSVISPRVQTNVPMPSSPR